MEAVMEAAQTFEHYNITGIDPGRSPVTVGTGYLMQLTSAEVKTYGDKTPPDERVSLGFSIVQDPTGGNQVGKIAWGTVFPDKPGKTSGQEKLNRLASQSGIKQTMPGEEGFRAWLDSLRSSGPRFTGDVTEYTKKNGQVETEVNLFSLRAA